MSEWQSPQDYPHRETNGIDRLVGAVRVVGEKARESTANLLRTAGIFITQSGMRVASSLTVEGDLTSTGSADITGTTHIGGATDIDGTLNVDAEMTVAGNATFSGAVAIAGTLSLPAGIIDNDALTSPQVQLSDFGNSASYAVAGAPGAVLGTFAMVVPAGYTKASYIAEAGAGIHNITGASNYAYLRVFASGPSGYLTWGSRQNVQIDAGHTRTAAALLVRAVDVPLVGGDVLTFWCEVYADTAMAASGANFASTAVLVTFTR